MRRVRRCTPFHAAVFLPRLDIFTSLCNFCAPIIPRLASNPRLFISSRLALRLHRFRRFHQFNSIRGLFAWDLLITGSV
jgi:hypothetical protein